MQVVIKQVLPIASSNIRLKARVITQAERDLPVAHTLRKARTDCKLVGVREKRIKEKV